MEKIINFKSKCFKSFIHLSIILISSNFQVFSSQEMEDVNSVKLKNSDFIKQAEEKHDQIKEKRTKLEKQYIELKELKCEAELKKGNLSKTFNDYTPEVIHLTSNEFLKDKLEIDRKKVKRIKEEYKKSLSNKDAKKLNFFDPKRHVHLPGSKKRKDKINELQEDAIYVQHRLTNSSNLQRMDTQSKEIDSLSADLSISKFVLKTSLGNIELKNKSDQQDRKIADLNQQLIIMQNQINSILQRDNINNQ